MSVQYFSYQNVPLAYLYINFTLYPIAPSYLIPSTTPLFFFSSLRLSFPFFFCLSLPPSLFLSYVSHHFLSFSAFLSVTLSHFSFSSNFFFCWTTEKSINSYIIGSDQCTSLSTVDQCTIVHHYLYCYQMH